MPDDKTPSNLDLGLYPGDPPPRRVTGVEVTATVLTAAWLGVVVLYGLEGDGEGLPQGTVNTVLTALAVLMPVALIWVAASAARTARTLRQEAARLQASIDAMRATYVEQQHKAGINLSSGVMEKLDALVAAQRTAAAHPTFTSLRGQAPADSRAAVPPKAPASDQPQQTLGLSTPAPKAPISVADFIKAMNFPENEHDKEGFRTLRRALEDPATERLIRASQDALTLLSQDGVYMDDLRPDHARPEIWRKFAHGERGRAIADLGGIHDRSSLVLAAGRMRKDPVFRDVVHHFLRHFDRTFTEFEKTASDADIAAMANTRTSRAFMLLGRVTGTFD
jgi:hypothetical protein